MADVAIRVQEVFPEIGGFSNGGSAAALVPTVEKYVKAFHRVLAKSGAMEKRMESYRLAVASPI